VQQLVHDRFKPGATTQLVVNQDSWPLGVIKKRPTSSATFQPSEPQQPALAVNRDAVIFGHGRSSASTVAELSTDADAAANLV
jgi:hypothetical protein